MSDDPTITWAALLAHWTDFARSAAALGDEGEDGLWKRAVPHVIALQATTMALGELDRIDPEGRPLALDRAELTCRDAAGAVHELWKGEAMPEGLAELIHDARVAFEQAANAGVEWIVKAERLTGEDPSALVARLTKAGFRGELFVPTPGVVLFKGSPAAFARGPGGSPPTVEHERTIADFLGVKRGVVSPAERIGSPRQVYRQVDFATGKVRRDVVVGLHETLPPGQPMLALAIDAGEATGVLQPYRGPAPVEAVEVVQGDEGG